MDVRACVGVRVSACLRGCGRAFEFTRVDEMVTLGFAVGFPRSQFAALEQTRARAHKFLLLLSGKKNNSSVCMHERQKRPFGGTSR